MGANLVQYRGFLLVLATTFYLVLPPAFLIIDLGLNGYSFGMLTVFGAGVFGYFVCLMVEIMFQLLKEKGKMTENEFETRHFQMQREIVDFIDFHPEAKIKIINSERSFNAKRK